MQSVPPALAAAFAERVTVSGPELCRLLPMDPKTLRRHCAFGTMSYTQTGFGITAPKRFTLEQVLAFLAGRSRTEGPPARAARWRSPASGPQAEGLLERLEREQREAVSRPKSPPSCRHSPALAAPPVYLPPSPAPAERSGLVRCSVKTAAILQRDAQQPSAAKRKPQPGDDDFTAWKQAQAIERRSLVAARQAQRPR